MTIRTAIENHIFENGISRTDAETITKALTEDQGVTSMNRVGGMQSRWGDDAEGYPAMLINLLKDAANKKAVEWLTANKPNHFAIALLAR